MNDISNWSRKLSILLVLFIALTAINCQPAFRSFNVLNWQPSISDTIVLDLTSNEGKVEKLPSSRTHASIDIADSQLSRSMISTANRHGLYISSDCNEVVNFSAYKNVQRLHCRMQSVIDAAKFNAKDLVNALGKMDNLTALHLENGLHESNETLGAYVEFLVASKITSLAVAGGDWLDDRALARIAQTGRLQELSLTDTAITAAGLASLQQLTKLKTLRLGNTIARSVGASQSGDQVRESYEVTPWHLTVEALQAISSIANLESLDLTTTTISPEVSLAPLKKLTKLRSFALPTLTTEAQTLVLFELQSLEELKVAFDGEMISQAAPEPSGYKPLKELRSLSLADSHIPDGVIGWLAKNRKLQHLHLTREKSGFAETSLSLLHALSHLKVIDLKNHSDNISEACLAFNKQAGADICQQ